MKDFFNEIKFVKGKLDRQVEVKRGKIGYQMSLTFNKINFSIFL